MTDIQQGAAYIAAVEALTSDTIGAKSPVLRAWLAECGDIAWLSVRADRSTLEGVWDEDDGIARVQADLLVVSEDGISHGIRINVGGFHSGSVQQVAIHAPTRTCLPMFTSPLNDEVRAVLDDPSQIAAIFDERADMLRCFVRLIDEVEAPGILINSTKALVDHIASLTGGWDRVMNVRMSVDESTLERSLSCHRDDDGEFRWTVPAKATVMFDVDDVGPHPTPYPTSFDVTVAFTYENDTALIDLVYLPGQPVPGTYAKAA